MKKYIPCIVFLLVLACNSKPEEARELEINEAKTEIIADDLEESGETLSEAAERTRTEIDSLLEDIE